MIRVLVADDHKLVREGLKQILGAAADVQVAGEAANGDEALALAKANDYDLALLDMSMPGLAGIELIKRLKLEKPALRLLVLSMHGEQQYAARALKAGASGYLTKDSAAEQLLRAIRKVAAGGVHISEAAAASLVEGGGAHARAVRPRVPGPAHARRRARADRDRRPAQPVGQDRQHPQGPHPAEARPGQHRRAGALRDRKRPARRLILTPG